MQAISEFLKKHPVRLRSVKVPDRDDVDWPGEGASHYVCILVHDGRHLLTYYSIGGAHPNPPGADDVLNCLASDAASVESARDFAGWCSEFGSNKDSIRERRAFRACRRQVDKLMRLLGEEVYEELLFETERL